MRYIFLLILIAGSIGFFVQFVRPLYLNVQDLRQQAANSGGSLSTASRIKTERDDLIAKYHSISKENLDSLSTLLPDSVNNIRLIIQMNALANKNNLSTLRNIDYKVEENKDKKNNQNDAGAPYGEFVISFQTTGQYKNFLAFLSDLEQNLRLVDVTGIEFSAGDSNQGQSAINYKVTLKTYWLKQ